MTTTLIRTIMLDYDLIEIHYNTILKNKPYLVRVYNYNNSDPTEVRLQEQDLEHLYQILQENSLL